MCVSGGGGCWCVCGVLNLLSLKGMHNYCFICICSTFHLFNLFLAFSVARVSEQT